MRLELPDEEATLALGARLAEHAPGAAVVYLKGALGAGKTTLVRGFLEALGYRGKVKSPTYTLLEPYIVGGRTVVHADLYRLASPEEVAYLGLGEQAEDALLLVEWPERGEGALPPPDLVIGLFYRGEGRKACLEARTPAGEAWLARLEERP